MLSFEFDALGWGVAEGSLKAHYFLGGTLRSLCGRWSGEKIPTGEFRDGDHRSSDNCARCRVLRANLVDPLGKPLRRSPRLARVAPC